MAKSKTKKAQEPKKSVIEPKTEETKTEENKTPDLDKEIQAVEEQMEIIGKVKSPVFQKSAFIKTKALTTPVCLYELPEDIRQYLINMGFGTNVYEKGEEWLIKHNADMKMIEKLKKFISEHYL